MTEDCRLDCERREHPIFCRFSVRLVCTALGLLSVGLTVARVTVAAERPNILFIFTDDQSHRTVGCYESAYDWVETPSIDKLSQQAVRFRYAYMSTWCMPSRATMLTGHHSYGVDSMRMEGDYPRSVYDPDRCPFWPRVFRRHGYVTAQIGKWHTGVDTGFGRDWDYQVVWNRPAHAANAGQYYDKQLIEENGSEAKLVEGYTTDWYTDRGEAFIRGQHREADKPWFLWLCYGAVHGPFIPANRHLESLPDAKAPTPADVFQGSPSREGKPEYVKQMNNWAPNEDGTPGLRRGVKQRTVDNRPIHGNTLSGWVRQYHQGVLALDEAVDRLMRTLEETGQADNTVVVFAADQGLAWGQHGFQQKLGPYDATIRGPLLIRAPGVSKAGHVSQQPAGGVDIAPTIFSLAGIELPWKMHGHDLTPQLRGEQTRRPLLTAHTGMSFGKDTDRIPTDRATLFATRDVPWWLSLHDGRYKYVRTLIAGETEELYDLERDPEELDNLALKAEHYARVKKLRAALILELKRTDAGMADALPPARPLGAR